MYIAIIRVYTNYTIPFNGNEKNKQIGKKSKIFSNVDTYIGINRRYNVASKFQCIRCNLRQEYLIIYEHA